MSDISQVVQLALLNAARTGGPTSIDAILKKIKDDPEYVRKLLNAEQQDDDKPSRD